MIHSSRRSYVFHLITFNTAITQEENGCQISCYIPLDPLDISSDWSCTMCKHTVTSARIRELEEVAQKVVLSGIYL